MTISSARFSRLAHAQIGHARLMDTCLGLAVSRSANTLCSLAIWSQSRDQSVNVFSRQALPMNWDFPEVNPFAGAAGDFGETTSSMAKSIIAVPDIPGTRPGYALQKDAMIASSFLGNALVSTDPPYYDNIGYADLSDFFYVWLRRSLSTIYPDLFSTVLVPKAQELVATPFRFDGSKEKAQHFFEEGLAKAFVQMRAAQQPDYPLTLFYAFKQSESDKDDEGVTSSSSSKVVTTASTGWETMLEGLIKEGFTIVGTWPMRTERPTGVKVLVNALASSIVLVCRPRSVDAPRTARRDFLTALRREMPSALKQLQQGNIAPVDLAQATIGPGMAVFSRYSRVMEADGSTMRVRTALQLINQVLDEVLAEQEGEFDADTRWAVAWFEQFGTGEGSYGDAETLSKAKNTSVAGLAEAGLLVARQGKVRLLSRLELPSNWDPSMDNRLTTWEATQQLIRALEHQGEVGAASLLARMPDMGEVARDLAYRLYIICERKGWAQEAIAYNSLVISWRQVGQLASEQVAATPRQQEMFT